MGFGAGISAQFGIADETTFNTFTTPTRFYEFDSESIDYRKQTQVGQGLRAGGQLASSNRRVVTTFDAGGDVMMDIPTRGLGLLLKHAMGSAPSGTVVTTGVYSYAFTLGDTYGRSFVAQVGVPQYGGTVTPKTVTGCKVSGFELSVANAGIAKGKFTIDGAGLVVSEALASASYTTSASVFHFAQGAITVDASPVSNIRDFTLTVDNVLKTDRYNLGGSGAKSQQNHGGFRKITGSCVAEFTDTTLLTKFLADTAGALVLTFTGNTIALGQSEKLVITLPAVKFDADTPKVAGPGPVDLSMTFEVYDDRVNEPLTILYQTSESSL